MPLSPFENFSVDALEHNMFFYSTVCTWTFPQNNALNLWIAYNIIRVGVGFILPLLVVLLFYGKLLIFLFNKVHRIRKSTVQS